MVNVGKYTIHTCYGNGKTNICQTFPHLGISYHETVGEESMFCLHLGLALDIFLPHPNIFEDDTNLGVLV